MKDRKEYDKITNSKRVEKAITVTFNMKKMKM